MAIDGNEIAGATYARRYDLSGMSGAFEAAQALYWHCANWHQGQSCELYAILSALDYRPGARERGPEADSTAEIIAHDLENRQIAPADLYAWIVAEIARAKAAEE